MTTAPARRSGGFDLIRIAAALLVVVSHCFDVTGHAGDKPDWHVAAMPVRLGRIGVDVFFVISGLLVATSWHRTRSVSVFSRSRAVRIWPGLVVVVVAVALVVGPIETSLGVGDYVTHPWLGGYLAHNLTMFAGMQHRLPGVFVGLPQDSANAPLWTLPYELWAYVVVLAFGVLRVLRRASFVALVTAALFTVVHFGVAGHTIVLDQEFAGLRMRDGVELMAMFSLGMLLALLPTRFDRRLLGPVGVAVLVGGCWFRSPVAYLVGLGLAVIGLGSVNTAFAASVHRGGDPSYGIYIWSYPIQQVLMAHGIATTTVAMTVASVPLSIAAGYLSWHFVEHPALRRWKPAAVSAGPDPALR